MVSSNNNKKEEKSHFLHLTGKDQFLRILRGKKNHLSFLCEYLTENLFGFILFKIVYNLLRYRIR